MDKYYYLSAHVPIQLEEKLDLSACADYSSTGIEDFSIDEPRVDQILGQRSYSGADLPLSVINEVEQVLTGSEKKYYFETKKKAVVFQDYLRSSYGLDSTLVETETQDWNEEWKKSYAPIWVSETLEVIPAWNKDEYSSKATNSLYIYPGMGFGTGGHETTYLCLKLFTKIAKSGFKPIACLDFGCGSGILAIAVRSFYRDVKTDLYDIDVAALDNCKQNIDLNNDDLDFYRLLLPAEREKINQKYNLVFANILQNVLLIEKEYLANSLTDGGYLILSGLLVGQEREVIDSYLKLNQNLKHIETLKKGDWVAVLMGIER